MLGWIVFEREKRNVSDSIFQLFKNARIIICIKYVTSYRITTCIGCYFGPTINQQELDFRSKSIRWSFPKSAYATNSHGSAAQIVYDPCRMCVCLWLPNFNIFHFYSAFLSNEMERMYVICWCRLPFLSIWLYFMIGINYKQLRWLFSFQKCRIQREKTCR